MPGIAQGILDVSTSLQYLKNLPLYQTQKPFQVYTHIQDVPESEKTNLEFEEHNNVLIRDVRGKEDQFDLDECGFQYIKHATHVDLSDVTKDVADAYLEEIKQLLLEKLKADRVFCYDFRVRRNLDIPRQGEVDLNDRLMYLRPVQQVHIDHTAVGGARRIRLHMKGEADELLGEGMQAQIINVWRPMVEPVVDWPLALCDSRSVDHADLISTDQVTRKYAGEMNDEIIIFKSFDNIPGSSFAPHAAFQSPHTVAGIPPRASIEVRALVFKSLT